jgi:DNA helicase-2/ATP-dependent DNA helicase PcrA
MDYLLSELNEPQRLAVQTTEGPLLIIAGAGSGKTKALTYRIAYLIKEKGVSPNHILAVTFTNKAAHEMKERIQKLLQTDHKGQSQRPLRSVVEPLVGTFHSVCVRILRKEIHHLGYENRFVIYDTADSEALMKKILKDHHYDEKQFNPKTILNHISKAKNNLIPETTYRDHVNSYFEEQIADIYPIYQKQLKKNQALDFDDLIFKTIQLWQQYPEILDRYQEKFKYISIDEYQDTNYAQYMFAKLLAEKYRNICVIGDDWQSIYSWRGADMTNILNFQKDYQESTVIKLEQNYRSTKVIVEAANHLIKQNIKRTDKTLWTEKESTEKIEVLETDTERDEAEMVLEMITQSMKNNTHCAYHDFAILYRTNAQSRIMEESFLRHGIPYKIIGGVGFYERKEIKDVIAYLKVIHNPADSISLLRIINTPPRKIGTTTIEKLNAYANKYDLTFFETLHRSTEILDLNSGTKQRLKSLYDLLIDCKKRSAEYPVGSLIKYILPTSEYKEFLQDGTDEGEERWQNVQELISVASKYDKLEPEISLATFLEEVSLISQVDHLNEKKEEGAILMTLHNAKGLEFPYVFIVGLEEGIFPHAQSQWTQDELEEERRLMYVGITRAKEKLYLLYARSRLLYGNYQNNIPSRFLSEIPAQYLHTTGEERQEYHEQKIMQATETPARKTSAMLYKDGDRIRHKSWGEGIIVQIKGDVATIAFQDPKIGIKKLALNIAPLEKI